METVPPSSKRCTKCGDTKPLDAFARSKRHARGRQPWCRACCDARKARARRTNIAAGRCLFCGETPAPGRRQCAEHIALQAETRARRKRLGRCRVCAADRVAGHADCQQCWLRKLAARHLGSKDRAAELLALLERQGWCCALSGVPLVQGFASVDHVVPRSRGGGHEISNLRWLHLDVNRARRDRSDEQYLAECRRVVAHADRG